MSGSGVYSRVSCRVLFLQDFKYKVHKKCLDLFLDLLESVHNLCCSVGMDRNSENIAVGLIILIIFT